MTDAGGRDGPLTDMQAITAEYRAVSEALRTQRTAIQDALKHRQSVAAAYDSLVRCLAEAGRGDEAREQARLGTKVGQLLDVVKLAAGNIKSTEHGADNTARSLKEARAGLRRMGMAG